MTIINCQLSTSKLLYNMCLHIIFTTEYTEILLRSRGNSTSVSTKSFFMHSIHMR